MSWLGFPCKIEKQTKQLHRKREAAGDGSRLTSPLREAGGGQGGKSPPAHEGGPGGGEPGAGPMRASQGARGGAGPPLGHFCSRIRLWSPECFENLKTVSFPLVRRQ